MTRVVKHLIFSSFLILSIFACIKEPNFPEVPAIEFLSIDKEIITDPFTGGNEDSVIVGLNFTDGDGDLGLFQSQIDTASLNFNYFVKMYRSINGKFEEVETLEPLNGFFPSLVPDGRVGPIEGKLYYSLEFFHIFTPKKDSVKFEIFIKDRKGNTSNTVETDLIILNQF